VKPYYQHNGITLYHGNSLDVLAGMEAESIDAVVCDPPYELGFMGKSWDSKGIAYNVGLWREVLRILKPGGHLLAFGGTRTYHRMTCAIEDAGFEIRDCIQWWYGSGFPKSLDVSKAIDKAAGAERAGALSGGHMGYATSAGDKANGNEFGTSVPHSIGKGSFTRGTPSTEDAQQWSGWGTALKPANEPIVMARKPLSEPNVASNVLKWGTGAINVDGCRIGFSGQEDEAESKAKNRHADFDSGARENRIYGADQRTRAEQGNYDASGRWPANVILSCCCENEHEDGCPIKKLDGQSGISTSSGGINSGTLGKRTYGKFANEGIHANAGGLGDVGGASRFFYIAKASRAERDEGLDSLHLQRSDYRPNDPTGNSLRTRLHNNIPQRNHHPTVKPVELMRYLCRLVTPKGGTVLDSFMGSGTTGVACVLEGLNFVGIDMDEQYCQIAQKRIVHWTIEGLPLFASASPEVSR